LIEDDDLKTISVIGFGGLDSVATVASVSSRISAKEARGGGSFEVGHISLGELLGVQEEEREQKRGCEGR
jgi:hypothetical protein